MKQVSADSRRSLFLLMTLTLGGLALMDSEPLRAIAQEMPADDDPGNDPLLQGRDHLVDASQSIRELVREKDLAGFTGIRQEPNRLTLYWKGIVPQALDSLVSKLANEGTTVVVHPVRWSRKQLLAESQRILEFANSSGIRVTQAGPTSDFSSIELVIDPADIGRAEREIRSSIRLELHAEASEIELVAGRWNDEPPFKAGAMMDCCSGAFGTNYEYCTLGFAVVHAGVVNAITAGHCAAPGTLWSTPEGDRLVGATGAYHPTTDSVLVSGQSYSSTAYVGVNYKGTLTYPVAGAADPDLGDVLTASGAGSGAHNVEVVLVDRIINPTGFQIVGPGFWTMDPQGDASVGDTDSGGPIVRLVSARNGHLLGA